jgi:hypothetical protein
MDGYSKLQTFGGKGSKLVFYVNGTKVNKHSLVNLATTKFAQPATNCNTMFAFWVQTRIWTCINNILKICIHIICGKGYVEVKHVFFSENHGNSNSAY